MPGIFISYSHKDEDWKDRLVTHLAVLRHQVPLDLWNDRRIAAGEDWHQEIQEAMAAASVAVLVVSANFLTSEFILKQEIPRLLERRDKEGVRIFPIIVKPCAWQAVGWLRQMQVRPKEGRSLSAGNEYQIDADLTAIAVEVHESLRLAGASFIPPGPVSPEGSSHEKRSSLSTLDALQPGIRNGIGMEFLPIPAGEFLMGSTNGYGNERPAHRVRISRPFYLARYEVTQAQWKAVMGNNPSSHNYHCDVHPTDDCPVERVSWEEVQKFIQKLNAREGSELYRLPTEAEWEYACRAGSTTDYSFGDYSPLFSGFKHYGWYQWNSKEETNQVGQKLPNAWGLYDMHGNVLEWVQDWYGQYPAEEVTDPQGPPAGMDRVIRGGGYATTKIWDCRSAYRSFLNPDNRGGALGFRLLRMV